MVSRAVRFVFLLVVMVAGCSVPSPELVDGSAGPLADAPSAGADAPVVPARLTVSPATDTAFGDVVLGTTSGASVYTVSNDGAGASSAIAITLGEPALGFGLASDGCTGKVLEPQTSCTFAVRFAPTAEGPVSTTFDVSATTGGTIQRGVAANGLRPGAIDIVETGFDFVSLGVDAAPTRHAFTIENTGAVMIGAPAPTISGTTDSYFVDASTCTAMLQPHATCTITVRFDPGTVGSKVGSLTVVASGGGMDAAMLTGTSVAHVQVTRTGNGAGQVTSTQAGITCGSSCAADYASSPVTLTATPELGSTFAGWTGDCHDTGTCTLDLSGAKTVTATFVAITPTLTVERTGLGKGTVTSAPIGIACGSACKHDFAFNAMVTLTATPESGSTFTGWSGACAAAGTAPCSLTMDRAMTASANFDAITPTLSVMLAGAGAGAVTSPSGISCGSTCTLSFTFDTPIVLTATPQAGSTFAGWSGTGAGSCTTAPACSLTMNQARDITATFDKFRPRLSITKSGAGAGTVTATGGVITCGTVCDALFDYNVMVTLSASPTASSVFTGWSGGGCSGNASTCVVTMDIARTVTATFAAFTPQLSIVKAGSGTGTVTANPAGPTCGSGCASYAYDTAVTLTATPTAGSNFTGWSGGSCSGTSSICTVQMTMARTVTATFDLQTPTLAVTFAGTGTGSVTSAPVGIACSTASSSCASTFTINTPVTLTATPAVGSTFTGWTGACGGASTCMVTMDAGHGVTATFTAITPTLSITKTGTGAGTVTSSSGSINCGSVCTANITYGEPVHLTATPISGSSFVGWSGSGSAACNGTGSPTCDVTMDTARDLTATFTAGPQTLTVTVAGTGAGTVTTTNLACSTGSCAQTYTFGTALALTAAPSGNATFTGWSGVGAGACTTAPTCAVTMDQARAVTATFAAGPQTLTITTSGNGSGRVTSSPIGIDCGDGHTACTLAVTYGASVTLTATPSGTSTFTGWTGCSGTGSCSVTMTAAKTADAGFAAGPQALAISLVGNGTGTVTSNPVGISCGPSCTATFTYNVPVTLTATPTGTSTFAGWSGDAGACATAATCTTTMDRARTIIATFDAGAQPLSVTFAGTGTGSVTSSPTGLACTGTCSHGFTYNTMVTLTATGTGGSTFAGWSAGVCGGASTCSVTMDQARSVTATFNAGAQPLTVMKTGTGATAGTVTTPTNVINCGTACTATFQFNVPVTLTATPGAGDTFAGWSGGGCGGAAATCTVPMTSATTVTASFTAGPRTLTVTPVPSTGGGRVDAASGIANCGGTGGTCSASYANGTAVALTATPASGYTFTGWSGDCAGTGACSVTMNQAHAVTATFAVPSYLLSVTPATYGTLTSSDGFIACGASCMHAYSGGTVVTLTATPVAGYHLVGWAGACTNASGTCAITMTMATSVTATFAQDTYTLTTSAPANGTITTADGAINCGVTCSKVYTTGTMTTLVATPAAHYHVVAWTGDCAGVIGGACTLTMTANKTATATFALDTLTLAVANGGTGAATGNVKANVGTINCTGTTGTCSQALNYNTPVTLTATPGANTYFTGWSGDCSGTGGCAVTMTAAHNVTANFGTYRKVTLSVIDHTNLVFSVNAGSTGGTLQPGTNPINCGATCSATYAEGSVVTLTASWDNFSSCKLKTPLTWTGCTHVAACTPAAGSSKCDACQLTVNNAAPVKVEYYDDGGAGCNL